MSRMLTRAALLVAAACLAPGAGAADAPAPKPYVILIGPGSFADPQIKARPTAPADAAALYDLFTDKDVAGVPADRVQLLTSDAADKRAGAKPATRANILAAFDAVADKATKEDRVWVFVTGSGAAVGEKTCFFAQDSTFKDRAKDAVFSADIEPRFVKMKDVPVVAFLDVNLKGFNVPGEKITANIMDMVRAFMGIKDKEESNLPENKLVLLANDGNAALAVDGRGIFAKVAGEALAGAADTEGGEADGYVTVDELVKYCEKQVPELARKVGKTNEEKLQVPFAITARSNHAVLTRNPKAAPKVEARLAKLRELKKDGKLTEELFNDGEKYLARMPKLKTPQRLRKLYETYVDGEITLDALKTRRLELVSKTVLADGAASDYSRRVLSGLSMVTEAYIKETKLADLTVTAVKGLYARADEKISPELQKQLDAAGDLGRDGLGKLLSDARLALGSREDLDDNHDVEWTLQMVVGKLDRYSEFVEKDEVERLKRELGNEFTGIGVVIRRELVRDGLSVVSPIRFSPAYKAGVKSGDLITTIIRPVNNKGEPINPPEEISTKGMKTEDAVKLIVGKPNTPVSIVVEREGAEKPIRYDLSRGRVEQETVLGYKRNADDSWDYFVDKDSGVGYIHLTQFAKTSGFNIRKAIGEMKKAGMRGLVFDVRENPGGFLPVVAQICDMFIDGGTIVEIRPRVGEKDVFRKRGSESQTDFPMVVLTNGHSASASEIMAACLQDHGRAVVMGERSYGKGSVQTIQEFLPTGGEIKMTIATFWRPSGKNLNKPSTSGKEDEDWGVRPNEGYAIKLPPEEQLEVENRLREWGNIPRRDLPPKKDADKPFKDRQLEAAVDYLKKQVKVASDK